MLEQVADYVAVGIDPGRATIFAHSAVPELGQLVLPFMSLVTVAELARNPTVKAESAGRTPRGLMLAYPVHQAADILSCRANVVPVGRDQLPHLELTRAIARRFNERYGDGVAVLPEPHALLGAAPLLLGTDGAKMSTSRGNAIALGASEDETARLIRAARTDADRRITFEPARRPEVSNLVLMAALCRREAPEAIAAQIGDRGATALKRLLTEALNERLRPDPPPPRRAAPRSGPPARGAAGWQPACARDGCRDAARCPPPYAHGLLTAARPIVASRPSGRSRSRARFLLVHCEGRATTRRCALCLKCNTESNGPIPDAIPAPNAPRLGSMLNRGRFMVCVSGPPARLATSAAPGCGYCGIGGA